MELKVGDRVKHQLYGTGTIVDVDESNFTYPILVDFDNQNDDLMEESVRGIVRKTKTLAAVKPNEIDLIKCEKNMPIAESIGSETKPAERIPIMKFSSEEQAQKLLEEWQDRLFLNDWTIVLLVNVSPGEIGEHLLGKNDLDYEGKNCVIYIVKPHDDLKNQIVKYCAEGILIHELLHCKYNLLRNNDAYESAFVGVHQHMMLEQMAKSLLMAKYNLKFDWFKQYRGN